MGFSKSLGVAVGVGTSIYAQRFSGEYARLLTPWFLQWAQPALIGGLAASGLTYASGDILGGNFGDGLKAGSLLSLIGAAATAALHFTPMGGEDRPALQAHGSALYAMSDLAPGVPSVLQQLLHWQTERT